MESYHDTNINFFFINCCVTLFFANMVCMILRMVHFHYSHYGYPNLRIEYIRNMKYQKKMINKVSPISIDRNHMSSLQPQQHSKVNLHGFFSSKTINTEKKLNWEEQRSKHLQEDSS
jgi:hypothetical protein